MTAITSSPSSVPTAAAADVRCLLGHKHVELTVTCLGSLLRHSRDAVALYLHDDGSLTDEDVQRLTSALAGAIIVRRPEADARMAEVLRRFPHSAKFRLRSAFGLKLLDTVHLSAGDTFAYCDSDILFFRPFRNFYALPDACDSVFMADHDDAYSVRSWGLLASRDLRLAQRINSGLIALRRTSYDPDRIEWYLSQPAHHAKPYFVEQTCWSMVAMATRGRTWSMKQVVMAHPGMTINEDVVAVHFVGMHRALLPQYLSPSQATTNSSPVESFPTDAVRRCTSARLAWVETNRVLERLAKRLKA